MSWTPLPGYPHLYHSFDLSPVVPSFHTSNGKMSIIAISLANLFSNQIVNTTITVLLSNTNLQAAGGGRRKCKWTTLILVPNDLCEKNKWGSLMTTRLEISKWPLTLLSSTTHLLWASIIYQCQNWNKSCDITRGNTKPGYLIMRPQLFRWTLYILVRFCGLYTSLLRLQQKNQA